MKKFFNILKTVYKSIKTILVKVVKAIWGLLVSLIKHKDFPLVLATWVLVGVTFWGVWDASKTNKSQLAEMRKATELQYRPYLDILHSYKEPLQFNDIFHWIEKDNDTESMRKIDFFETKINNPDLDKFSYELQRKIDYVNYGLMPLRIKRGLISAISKKEWEEDFNKSYVELVRYIRSLPALTEPETDIIVQAKNNYLTKNYTSFERRMEIFTFRNYLTNDKQIVLYPYTYVEYEDFFGKQYNSILIELLIFKLNVDNDVVIPSLKMGAVERFRRDVLLEEQRAEQDLLNQVK